MMQDERNEKEGGKGRKEGRRAEIDECKVKDERLRGQWREEDGKDRWGIGHTFLALSLEIRAIGQDTVWFAVLVLICQSTLSQRNTHTHKHTCRKSPVCHWVSAESWEVIMRRQVLDRLLVAGLSFVIREKRRAGLFFFFLPPSLLFSCWRLSLGIDRQVMGHTHTHTCTCLMGQVWFH